MRGVVGEATQRRSIALMMLLGLLFHLAYLPSIVDIHFRSPIVHGMRPVSSVAAVPRDACPPSEGDAHSSVTGDITAAAPAKRLVLFVADGLRADKLYEAHSTAKKQHVALGMPSSLVNSSSAFDGSAWFLRQAVERHGRFGVSHSRVPTESRPGHVAMIAGFYEDVSAVFKGWKVNPVEFDSVFNRTQHTYAWGSPDILPMFGESTPHMVMDYYSADFEDFAEDGWVLDEWVFSRVHALLDDAERSEEVRAKLAAPNTIFFLHLLGLDSNGHAHRPYSSQYLDNIQKVDSAIAFVYERMERIFADGETAYIFTADHGMSDKGSHGDGQVVNTETPLVAWGAGIGSPTHVKSSSDASPSPSVVSPPSWNVSRFVRRDVEQASIAPLMSALLGLTYPANSVGVLPTQYLRESGSPLSPGSPTAAPSRETALMLFNNARQMLEHAARKSQLRKQRSTWFSPFPGEMDGLIDAKRQQAIAALCSGNTALAVKSAKELAFLALDTLYYYQTYDRVPLMAMVSTGYIGWILFVVVALFRCIALDLHISLLPQNKLVLAAWLSAFAVAITYLGLQSAPALYYGYYLFAVLFPGLIAANVGPVIEQARARGSNPFAVFLTVAITAVLAQVLVMCYFYRRVLSLALVGSSVWTAARSTSAVLARATLCFFQLLIAVFPLLSTSFPDHVQLVYVLLSPVAPPIIRQ